MTKQFSDVSRDNPTLSKVLVVLFSVILVFVTLALGWQQWVYSQQRADVQAITGRQDLIISELKARQDRLASKHDDLAAQNAQQDQRIAREYVTLERYACDLREMKDSIKTGFESVTRQFEVVNRNASSNAHNNTSKR
jgi:hypothetical protein